MWLGERKVSSLCFLPYQRNCQSAVTAWQLMETEDRKGMALRDFFPIHRLNL